MSRSDASMVSKKRADSDVARAIAKLEELGLKTRLEAVAKERFATLEEVISKNRIERVRLARIAVVKHLAEMRDTPGGKPVFGQSDIGRLLLRHPSSIVGSLKAAATDVQGD